jgi:hypothetical protein
MSISLLEELQVGEYETAVFLTYTINLRFFELMILPRLRRMGISRIGVLVDQRGYQESFADPVAQEFCGQEYILAPVRLPRGGIQHAKLIWLQKQEIITAYVGSHNLTMAGYNDQVEITAKLTSKEQGHIHALRELHNVVTSIVQPAFDYVWRHTKAPPETSTAPTLQVVTSYSRPLIEQIIDHVVVSDTLRIITPFLDVHALKTLADAIQAQTVVLDLPKDGADIPLREVTEALPNLQPRFLADRHNRRLHAKAYQFANAKESWVAIGSANCTQAALIKSMAEGGNLEFLVLLRDTHLPDEMNFMAIADPITFPHTGRNWDSSPLSPSTISIEKATYQAGQLSVEWKLLEKGAVSDIALYTNGNRIAHGFESAISISFEPSPRVITLKAAINGNRTETSAWVINYDALDVKVSQAKRHKWVERIASSDPRQHADSIALWLEQEIQELLWIQHETESPHEQIIPVQKGGDLPSVQTYEVFAYSADPTAIQTHARAFLETYSSTDPLGLLRVLLIRLAAEPPFDVGGNVKGDGDSYDSTSPHNYSKRQSASQHIVKNLCRQLDGLVKTTVSSTVAEQIFVSGLRTLLGAIVYICLDGMKDSNSRDEENLTQHFIYFLKWLVTQPSVMYALRNPALMAPLLLGIGAVASIAERCKDIHLYSQLRNETKKLGQVDPEQAVAAWEKLDPEGSRRFLTLLRKQNIWHQIEPHLLALFGIAPGHIRRQIKHQWGFLLELQEADVHLRPERGDLYARAKVRCPDMQIWQCYDAARRAKRLPVLFHTSGNSCSQCHSLLPTQLWQRLKRGDAVICDSCRRILIL